MADLKTRATADSVPSFLGRISDPAQQKDARALLAIMKRITGKNPVLWGSSIIGFGTYHYQYATGREGDWPRIGFAPRKGNLTVYIMPGLARYGPLLKALGKHKTGGSCLHIRRLEDVHLPTLKKLIASGYKDAAKLDHPRDR
jgi:hypothetical protein